MRKKKADKKPEIEQLERDLYSHMHHFEKLNSFRYKIEELQRMIEKSKPMFDDPHHNRKVSLITQKDAVVEEMKKSRHYTEVQYIESLMAKLNPNDRLLISDKFFYRESYEEIAERYGYDYKATMYDRIQTILKRMLA